MPLRGGVVSLSPMDNRLLPPLWEAFLCYCARWTADSFSRCGGVVVSLDNRLLPLLQGVFLCHVCGRVDAP